MLDYTHSPWLVAASLAIALMAGFSGLSMTRDLDDRTEPGRRLAISVSAIVLGWGIWSMHFVAMLGLRLPVPYSFDALVTLVSALTAILVSGLALLVVHYGPRRRSKVVAAGAILGAGIPLMHYIGMSGMELCRAVSPWPGVLVAFAVSIGLGVVSFVASFEARSPKAVLFGAAGFGLAVFTVHFVAMAGTGFVPEPARDGSGPMLGRDALAFGVTVSAFVLSGGFLLTGASFVEGLFGVTRSAQAAPEPESGPDSGPEPEPAAAGDPTDVRLPYERNAQTRFVPIQEVLAVRAEGHYTQIFTAEGKLFCPWSISEVARRVPDTLLTRTHRSYLANLERVVAFERKKDTALCRFDRAPDLSQVPVSRSYLPRVRSRLGL